ncbi:restriction endonuclease subunit S [Salinibacter ruber]|uniref:restriction endonuclease subunit S n=1 Tax=Salinibacter ruber TaxID=146919 RepID=UPI002072F4E5|nr:restriction endonuclease subunit S [Salinibacter ruber]
MSEDPDFDMKVVKKDTMKERTSGAAAEQDEEPTSGRTLDDLPEIEWVPDDWDLTTIGEVAESVVGGGTPLKSEAKYWGGKIPWASVKDLDGTTADSTEDFITEEGVENSATNLIPSGSIIVSTRMTVGEAFMNLVDMAINQDLKAIRPDQSRSNTYFLTYALRGKDEYLKSLGRGTTVSGITTADLKRTHLSLPPLPEQRKIASVLYAVDQAIQKTEAIIEQATQAQRGLLRELLTEGFNDHETTNAGALGEIPTDWRTEKLGQVADVQRGKFTHRPRNDPDFYDGAYPFIQTGEVVEARGKLTHYSQTLNEKGRGVSKRFDAGTIVITIAGNIGDTAIATFPIYFPDSLVGITAGDEVDPYYLEFFLRSRKKYLNRLATETTQKNLNLSLLRPIDVALPPLSEQREIAGVLKGLDSKIRSEKRYTHQLQSLKRGLMQDLLTGEVRTMDKAIEVLGEVKAHG